MAETPAGRDGDPERWRAKAEARLASLAKPPGALGTLEDWCVTLCVAHTAGAGVYGPRHGAATRGTTRTGAQL